MKDLDNVHRDLAGEKTGAWLAAASGLCYGLLAYFGVTLMGLGLSPTNLSFWRFAISFLVLALLMLMQPKRTEITWQKAIQAWVLGALFYCPSGVLFFMASRYISTGQSMVIFFTYPAFVMLLSYFFYGHKLKRQYLWSFLVILLGLMLLVDLRELSFDLRGIALSLISAFSYAFYILLSKKNRLPPLASTMLVSLGCASSCLLLALADQSFAWPNLPEQWLHIMGIAIICSALPILLLLQAMRYISADQASLLSVLEPVATVFFGVILLGEVITVSNFVGVLFTLIGTMSITMKKKP